MVLWIKIKKHDNIFYLLVLTIDKIIHHFNPGTLNISFFHPLLMTLVDEGEKIVEEFGSRLNLSELTPLSPEVIQRQATVNIGTIGHVAHGKSTVVKAISGVQTVRFKNELERNITIKLGYANAKVKLKGRIIEYWINLCIWLLWL